MSDENTKLPLLASLAFVASIQSAHVQAAPTDALRNTIVSLDKALFDAFNACDLNEWRRYLAEDIEFYQDNDDVTTTREQLEPSFHDRCGPDNKSRLRRELVLETIEVHPIQGYGAVQLGSHQFWLEGAVEQSKPAATPRFVHLWRNNDGVWQITRVISYGH